MSSKVARHRDQDMPPRFRVGPFVDLTHPSFKNLIPVKTGIFAQQRMRQGRNDQFRRVTQCEVARHELSRLVDPVLPIESVQQSCMDVFDC